MYRKFHKKVIIANFFSTQKITFEVAPNVFWMTKTNLRRKKYALLCLVHGQIETVHALAAFTILYMQCLRQCYYYYYCYYVRKHIY